VIVVTDTSVILNLCLLGQEGLLVPLFGLVSAPTQVVIEFQRLAAVDSRFSGLVFPEFIQKVAPADMLSNLLNPARLHGGEIAALSLAMELGATTVLMDERAGRAAATALGLRTVGLLGILIQARRRSLISELAPLLDRLQTEARFWISRSLRESVLNAVGEPN
jgi:predicted nucleic acid-binding protein